MEDQPRDDIEDEDYFSLLDMFVCTRFVSIKSCDHLNEKTTSGTSSSPSARVPGSHRISSGPEEFYSFYLLLVTQGPTGGALYPGDDHLLAVRQVGPEVQPVPADRSERAGDFPQYFLLPSLLDRGGG